VRADAPAGDGPYLIKAFPAATKVHLELDLHGTCATNEADLVSIDFPLSGGSMVSALVYQSPASAHLAVGCEGSIADAGACSGDLSLPGVNVTTFQHYQLDVDLSMQAFQVSVGAIDGGAQRIGLPLPPIGPGPFQIRVGVLHHSQLGAACNAYFDDVVLDAS
jgi:hypothetical protein